MGKKINQKLLNEELKKFRLLSEYKFYTEEPKKEDDLILGSVDEADEDPNAPADETNDAGNDSKTAANDASATADDSADAGEDDSQNMFGTEDAGVETAGDTGDEAGADTGNDAAPETGDETTGDEAGANTGEEEVDVDVDVTQLVKGSEEAKQSAEDASQKTSELLAKFSELEQRVSAMDSISTKIQDLEKEIVKRNPTPVEKLEMRSMDSFPYNIKLTDYWKDVEGYDTGVEKKPEEYVLRKDDVDTGYVDASIKKTFDVPEDYEEEDIEA